VAEDSNGARTIDEETLRYLARVLAGQSEVRGTSLFPANKQESLLVSLNPAYYPAPIEEVWLELRVYTNGDFHVSYIENYMGERRRCRWDRHDQDHNARDHFHTFPTASTAGAQDRTFPADVTALLETIVLPWVEDRLGTIWEE
jgi:hypothetical protein